MKAAKPFSVFGRTKIAGLTAFDERPATLADWTIWAQARTPVRLTPRQMTHYVETLYRFYAFWHWYDPARVRRQPWPTDRRERQRWALQASEALIMDS